MTEYLYLQKLNPSEINWIFRKTFISRFEFFENKLVDCSEKIQENN